MLMNNASATPAGNNGVNQNVWKLENSNGINKNTIEKDINKLLDALQSDNLIDKSTYLVATFKNWLFIDGTKQPADINNKYKKYFDGKGDFVIRQTAKKN